jgi:iron complex outermembrane receptor protein
LKSIPGFTVIRKGGIDGDPLLRGQGGSRLNVLIDGTSLLGGCGMRMDPPTAYVFPESFDSIKVLKGPQSVRYGGGVLGTVLMERQTEPFSAPGVRGNASALYGSFDRNDEMLDVAAGDGNVYVRAIGTHSSSSDYKDGNGKKVHSLYERRSATGILGVTPSENLTIEGTIDASDAEAAYGDRMMDGAAFDRLDAKLLMRRNNVSPLVKSIEAVGYYDYIDHVMDRFSLRPWTGGMMAALNNPDRTNWGGRLVVELTPSERTNLTIGGDYNHDVHTGRGLTAAQYMMGVNYRNLDRVRDMTFQTFGFFGEANHDLTPEGDRRVIGGYRLNIQEAVQENTAAHLTDNHLLHNVFARYEQDVDIGFPVTLYAGIGHTQRAPDYWERRDVFTLDPERTTQVDVGVLHNSGNWKASFSLFAARIEDYIVLSSTAGRGKNIDAQTLGGEAELTYSFAPSWSVGATLSYVHGENLSEDRPLPQMPPLDTTWSVAYDNGTYLGGVLVRAVAGQDRIALGWGNIVGQDLAKTGGFVTVSASAGWRPTKDSLISVGVDNLLDQAYAEHVSRGSTNTLIGAGYEQTLKVNEPGRTFWVKGSLKF